MVGQCKLRTSELAPIHLNSIMGGGGVHPSVFFLLHLSFLHFCTREWKNFVPSFAPSFLLNEIF